MYGYIRWTVVHSDDSGVTVLAENTGIGLEILPSPSCLSLTGPGTEVSWHLHEHHTDNGNALYGFSNSKEKVLFRRLLKISGVGGKTALALLGIGSEWLIKAVAENDEKLLSGVPGIGKKTALKILIELKGTIDAEMLENLPKKKAGKSAPKAANSDILESLIRMGYDKASAEDAISDIDPSAPLDIRMPEAIRKLAKRTK